MVSPAVLGQQQPALHFAGKPASTALSHCSHAAMDHSEEQPQAEALPEEQAGTEEEQAAAAAVQAAPVDLQQLAALEIPQLVDYSGLSQGQPNLMWVGRLLVSVRKPCRSGA